MILALITNRDTKPGNLPGVARIFLGVMFLMTGVMKYTFPMLWNAWSGQLIAGGLPFYEFTRYTMPAVEIVVGTALIIGFYSRLGSLITLFIMVVAAYGHIVADDPNLFPLQPHQPVIPVVALIIGAYLLWKGGGSWSKDLRFS